MKSFKDTVKEVSSKFLNEAKNSPQLIADMAKMEFYMAESYNGRLFVELLQNADDAKSTRVISFYNNGNLYFANNGKPFDENDLNAISRSGASEKKRGKTIGYRGIGFKSASAISNEIIIYSANTFFTFSKEKCSQLLNMKPSEVPTIRIPLFLEFAEQEIIDDVNLLKDNGYSTVFVFKNVDISLYLDEINEINEGFFLFLNNVSECAFEVNEFVDKYEINRFTDVSNEHIEIKSENGKTEWMICKNRSVAVAFLIENGMIVPCNDSQAVYHCYLPTLEKSIINCKINADFSTDPSRKHITMDDKTKEALLFIGEVFVSVLELAFKEADTGKYKNLLHMYLKKTTISKINFFLDEIIEKKITERKWIKLGNGDEISPEEYELLPSSFDIESPKLVRTVPGKIAQSSVLKTVYENIDGVEEFMGQYSSKQMNMSTISQDLANPEYVKQLDSETHTQLLTSAIRESKIEESLDPNYSPDIQSYVVKNENKEYEPIRDVVNSEQELDINLKKELSERLSLSEIKWTQKQIDSSDFIQDTPDSSDSVELNSQNEDSNSMTIHIAKWRDAEVKCVLIEESMGNTAIDVSLKNYGYDVESTTATGEKRYIEVKSVKKDFSFSLTNNEYTAAHQYGDNYYICLLLEDEDRLIVQYIQNPLANARFEKKIKQWEWICLECKSTTLTFNLDN